MGKFLELGPGEPGAVSFGVGVGFVLRLAIATKPDLRFLKVCLAAGALFNFHQFSSNTGYAARLSSG
jgi:hypothetical protein